MFSLTPFDLLTFHLLWCTFFYLPALSNFSQKKHDILKYRGKDKHMAEQSLPLAGTENSSSTLLSRAPRRAILVGVDMPGTDWPVEESLDELAQLASTAGITNVDRVVQRLWYVSTTVMLCSLTWN